MAITRLELRRDIAQQMHDLLTLTAETGSDNMLSDPVELTDFDNTFVGSQIVCVESADPQNLGHVARVLGSNSIGNSISFTPPLPTPLQPGDVFDMHNLRGRGFRVQEYNQQIGNVIRAHSASAPRAAESAPVVFDAGNPFIDVPEGWIALNGVVARFDNYTYDVHAGRYDGARGWRLDQSGRRIEVSGEDRIALHGSEIILYGFTGHPPVNSDTDKIYLNAEFISLTARSNLAQRRRDPGWDQWAAEWARMAAGVRPAKIFPWPADTVSIEED